MKIENIKKSIKKSLKKIPKDEEVSLDLQTIYEGHYNIKYKGVPAIKCPFDYVMLQMIIFEVKPDLIIEIGSNHGGTALYMSDLLKLYNPEGEVHSIDVTNTAAVNYIGVENVKFFNEGWEKYDTNLISKFSKVLIVEDAEHSYKCSIGALNKFASFVSVDSYFIVEDGIVDALDLAIHYKGGGPLEAIREFLSTNDNFIVDRKWCDMFGKNATFNVNGYLKRIK